MKGLIVFGFLGAAALGSGAVAPAPGEPAWSFNATIIEACSCPMFCQCYFNAEPHSRGPGCHSDEAGAYCRFNNAFRVNRGSHGGVELDGAKFWVAGDLGGDFSQGEMDWAVAHFDTQTTQEQRDAIVAILGHVYPVKWGSFTVGEAKPMKWEASADSALAQLDGGKAAEVRLKRFGGMTSDPVVIHNLKYWGAPRNEGFVLMPNEVEAYRVGEKGFEFQGTNGFMITIDIASADVEAGGAAKEAQPQRR